MSANFPDSPSVNDTFTVGSRTFYYDGAKWVAANTSAATTAAFSRANAPVFVSITAPGTPVANSLWWNSETGSLMIRYTDADTSQWVEVGALGDGNQPRQDVLVIALSDETTTISAGVNKFSMNWSKGFVAQNAFATLSANGSSGNTHIDINKNGTSIFSTNITIMAANSHSRFGGSQPALSGGAVTFNELDKMNVDIDLASTSAAGLKVHLLGYYTS